MSCSDGSNRVLNEPQGSDEIAQHADLFSFSMQAGYTIDRAEHAEVDGTWTSTAVKALGGQR